MKDYELYIFDFDMTLVDSLKPSIGCYRKAFEVAGFPFDERKCSEYMRESMNQTFGRFSDCTCKLREFVTAFIMESEKDMVESTSFFSESMHVIEELYDRGKILCIASGKTEYRIRQTLDRFGITDHFDQIVGYERMVEQKPSPYCIDLIMGKYDIPRRNACFIGDSPNDMLCAINAGVDAIHIDRGDAIECVCDHRIHDLSELIE